MYENRHARVGVVRLLKWQLVICLVCVSVSAAISGGLAAYSAFLGAMICILPSQYFAYRVFKFSGARSAKQIVKSLYRGEAIKFLITILLFAVVFKFIAIAPIAFFISFIALQMLNWVTPLLFVTRKD